MCFGIIAAAVTSNIRRKGSKGASRVNFTVSGSGALASLILAKMLRARGASSIWNFITEKITPSAEQGGPFGHFTVAWKWKGCLRFFSAESDLLAGKRYLPGPVAALQQSFLI